MSSSSATTNRLKELPAVCAIKAGLPSSQAPQLATSVDTPPPGDQWISELKFDGYRLLVWIDRGRVRLVTRNGHDWTQRMPRLAQRFAGLNVDTALIDGEMVALRPDGTDSFHDLQGALSEGRDGSLYFYAFDLLHLNGWDVRPCKLVDRKQLLAEVDGWNEYLRYAHHIEGKPDLLLAEARRLKQEGIICKRADAPYRAGRTATWLKVKCLGREEFVVLGWLPPGGSRKGIGSLALGFYDADKALHYAGSVGTGFNEKQLIALRTLLDGMVSDPPASLLYAGERPDTHIRWIEPKLVVEVSFTAWSGEGRVRHPVHLGLREDKAADEVVMAVPDAEKKRLAYRPLPTVTRAVSMPRSRWKGAVPPLRPT